MAKLGCKGNDKVVEELATIGVEPAVMALGSSHELRCSDGKNCRLGCI